jgi:hypothetical protein
LKFVASSEKINICIRNRTIGYRIIQCVLGFPVNDCVPMNTYMTRDPCENYMFTNSNERPECIPCNSNFSLKHVLIDCVDVADVRQTFYNANS